MPTPHYTPNDIPAFTRARSDALDTEFNAIEAAFNDLPTVAELKEGTTQVGTDSGAADAYVVAMPYARTAYADGYVVVFKVGATNTGASTINVDSLGVKNIKRGDGSALSAGDLVAAKYVTLQYNATSGEFEIQTSLPNIAVNASASAAAAAASAAAAAASASDAAASAASIVTQWIRAELVGSGLAVATVGLPSLAALNGTDVAFIDDTNDELRTYRWNGSTWALVGSGLAIATVGDSALAALNSTDVAFIDSSNSELRTYRWNGSAWALVGSGLAIACGIPTITALNSTDVAFIDITNDELRTYRWNGSAWALVGSGLAIATVGRPSLAALNGTDVAFIDTTNDELRTYRWDGSAWALVGSGLAVATVGTMDLAALNGTDVAFIDNTNSELRTYRFSFYIGDGPYRP